MGFDAVYERKTVKYADLVAECMEGGWHTRLYLEEVGARRFVEGEKS